MRFWRYEQMDVVGHKDIGVYSAAMTICGRAQELQIKRPVPVGMETRSPVVSALNDVERNSRQL